MSREIKFRAWDIDHKRMNRGGFFVGGLMGKVATVCGTTSSVNPVLKLEDNFILMQYTGLKDKEGVEIYEGDIVGAIFRDNVPHKVNLTKAQVKFYEGCFYFVWIEDSGKMPMHQMDVTVFEHKMPRCKVIGNIHQHPGLLAVAAIAKGNE